MVFNDVRWCAVIPAGWNLPERHKKRQEFLEFKFVLTSQATLQSLKTDQLSDKMYMMHFQFSYYLHLRYTFRNLIE